ncbi:Oxoglutarate/iron-dependent dioxygenase [Sesbania bispinosa]|nr:Oxoglutarate/iron-dependent dioxygenase [Sesbania bispinosa]
MEPIATTILRVPFVQEIAKEAQTKVPDRYVRPHHERPILSTTAPLSQVPVIDLTKLLSEDHKGPELESLHHACKEWGFFQLINHGVNTSLLENVKKGAKQFFNLPMEEKKFEQREGDSEGYGQLSVASEEQKLEWGDTFHIDDLESYYAKMNKLAIQIFELMAKALTIDTAEITKLFAVGTQATTLNYYPACPQPDLVLGLNPHSDAGGLTIVLQANEVEGLQIRKDGLWIPVKPLPNAFIINIGDMLEVITNGVYRSIEHRVTVNSEKERLSIATFNNPSIESVLVPSPSLVTPTTPAVFRKISFAEYLKDYLSQERRSKSLLDSIRINRSSK